MTASFESFCLASGIEALVEMMENDAQAACGPRHAKRLNQAIKVDSYQMLRINEAPTVEVHHIDSNEAPGGIGEPGTAAIAPAVVNAIFAATGKRLRKLPIDTEQIKVCLKDLEANFWSEFNIAAESSVQIDRGCPA